MSEEASTTRPWVAIWSARLAALLVTCFLAMFAVRPEAGTEGLLGRFLHLVPALICVALLVLAWRKAWLGTIAFAALAAFYAWWARGHWDWILAISGPLLLTAGLHAWAWRAGRQ